MLKKDYTGGKTTLYDPKSHVHLYYCISWVDKICFGDHNTMYFYTNSTRQGGIAPPDSVFKTELD